MTTLLLMRHGKSDWSAGEDDTRRPLAPRGRRGARSIGVFLAKTGHVPDAAVTSPAERAFETVRLAMEAGEWSCPVREANALYGGDTRAVINELQRESASVGVLLAMGHEPTWSECVAELIGGGEVRMPTAAIACIEFGDLQWKDVGPGAGVLLWLVTPRLLSRA